MCIKRLSEPSVFQVSYPVFIISTCAVYTDSVPRGFLEDPGKGPGGGGIPSQKLYGYMLLNGVVFLRL